MGLVCGKQKYKNKQILDDLSYNKSYFNDKNDKQFILFEESINIKDIYIYIHITEIKIKIIVENFYYVFTYRKV